MAVHHCAEIAIAVIQAGVGGISRAARAGGHTLSRKAGRPPDRLAPPPSLALINTGQISFAGPRPGERPKVGRRQGAGLTAGMDAITKGDATPPAGGLGPEQVTVTTLVCFSPHT